MKKRLITFSKKSYLKNFKKFALTISFLLICLSTISPSFFEKNNAGKAFAEKSALFKAETKICIDKYYKKGAKINDPELPDNMMWMPFSFKGFDAKTTEITPVTGNTIPLNWDETGSFSNELRHGKHGKNIKKVLSNHGINIEKLNNLLDMIGKEKCVSFYDSGYMVIFDDNLKKTYTIKTKPNIAIEIEKIEFELIPHGI